jgi:hypothetical protein
MLDEFLRKWLSEAPKAILNFGSGVLGKTAPVVGAGVIVLGAIAISIDNIWVQLALGAGVCGLIFYFTKEAFKFAHAHPDHALLGGGNLVQALKIQQAAKDPKIIEGEAVPTANTSPPLAITSGGD